MRNTQLAAAGAARTSPRCVITRIKTSCAASSASAALPSIRMARLNRGRCNCRTMDSRAARLPRCAAETVYGSRSIIDLEDLFEARELTGEDLALFLEGSLQRFQRRGGRHQHEREDRCGIAVRGNARKGCGDGPVGEGHAPIDRSRQLPGVRL